MSISIPTAAMGGAPSEPLEIVLELARSEAPGDAYAFRFEPQAYLVRWEGGSYASARFPWGDALLQQLEAIAGPRPDPVALASLGAELRAFLGEADWGSREAEITAAIKAGRPARVTIRSAAAELYALPWELITLRGSEEHLGELAGCLLRYEWPGSETATPPAPPVEPGRMLFAYSAAGGAVPAAEHLAAIRRACKEGHHPFDPERDVIESASLARIRDALRAGPPVAVLHLLCHGGRLDTNANVFGLCLNSADPGGPPEVVDAGAIRRLMKERAADLRLLVLSACHGADAGDPGNALGSTAQAAHQAGVAAVVASRRPLTTAGSIALTEELYSRLLARLAPLEDAFLAARARLSEDTSSCDWASIQLYARASDGPEHRPFVVRPYRGLLVFQPEHARLFFGREEEIKRIAGALRAMSSAWEKPRLLAVVGASGTGKSSLVRAGVIPELPEHSAAIMRPGSEPFEELAAALAPSPSLLVVDQFEEVFTHVQSAEAQRAFVRRLLDLSTAPGSELRVVLTMRAEFLGRCGEIVVNDRGDRLDALLYDEAHRVFLAQMSREQMREAIERPAARVGLSLEGELSTWLLDDVGAEPGALPLLEHVLDQLWTQRSGSKLTERAYREMGGVRGALGRHADKVWDQSLSEAERAEVKRLLVKLVGGIDGTAGGTRRRVAKPKLLPSDKARADVFEGAAKKLADARLLVIDSQGGVETIEVAHEELIRSWARLGAWLREVRRADIDQVEGWAKGVPSLLQGQQLEFARRTRAELADYMDPDVLALIAASEEAAARRSRNRRLGVMAVVASALVLAAVMGALALWARASAERAQAQAMLAGAREQVARGRPEWAAQLLLASGSLAPLEGWESAASDALGTRMPYRVFVDPGRWLGGLAMSPDGARIAASSTGGSLRLWWLDAAKPLESIPLCPDAEIHAIAWSPRGDMLAAACDKGKVVLRAMGGKQDQWTLEHGDTLGVSTLAFDPSGERLATGAGDGHVRVWSVRGDPALLKDIEVFEGAVSSLGFRHDGAFLVGTGGGRLAMIDPLAGRSLNLTNDEFPKDLVAVHPSLPYVAFSIGSGMVRLLRLPDSFDRANEGKPRLLWGSSFGVAALAWSHNGESLAVAADDRIVRLIRVYSAENPSVEASLARHTYPVTGLAFTPDDRTLITSSRDGTALAWSVRSAPQPFDAWGEEAAWSPDSRHLAISRIGAPLRVWDSETGEARDLGVARLGAEGQWGSAAKFTFDERGEHILLLRSDDAGGSFVERWALRGGASDRSPTDTRPLCAGSWSFFQPGGAAVVATDNEGNVRLCRAGGEVKELRFPDQPLLAEKRAWSRDGRRLLVGTMFNCLVAIDVEAASGALLSSCQGEGVGAFDWEPRGTRFFVGTASGAVKLVEGDGRAERELFKVGAPVNALKVSPDGSLIAASYGFEGHVRVWGMNKGAEVSDFVAHPAGTVYALAWSPDSQTLATGASDKTAAFWTVDGRSRSITLAGHQASVLSLEFSADGKRLVTMEGGMDPPGVARAWTLDGDLLAERLRHVNADCLPAPLRQTYLSEDEATAAKMYGQCEATAPRERFKLLP